MKSPQELLTKVEALRHSNPLDLSKSEDLAVALMNLIALEEHLYFSFEKTHKDQYLDLLNDIRQLRIESYKRLSPHLEGEGWCIGKHLLAASMRLLEVGTKTLKEGNVSDAKLWFDQSFNLFGMFWQVTSNTPSGQPSVAPKSNQTRFTHWLKHSLDCCKE